MAMEHHPDRNQHDPQERGAVQGGQRGLRRPEGRPEEGGLRPLRPCRLRERPRRAAAGSAAARAATSPRPSPTSSTTSSATSWAGGGGAGARPARGARLGPALQPAADAGGGLPRQAGDDHRAVERGLRGLPRHRRRGRRGARDLPDLLGPRQGAGAAGLLHRRADLPDLRRARPDHQEPLHRPAPAPAGCARTARSTSTSRPGSRPARGSGWPARARRGCAAGRRAISTSSSRSSAHPIFERDNQNLYCRIPVSHDDRGARRRDRRADARRRQDPGQGAGRACSRASSCGCAARACRRCAAPGAGDLYIELAVETPVNLSAPAARAAARVRGGGRATTARRPRTSSRKVKGFWEGMKG